VARAGRVACRDGRALPVLSARMVSGREGPGLRALAAGLLGELGDAGAAALAQALPGLKTEALADPALEVVAVAALKALAGRGGARALAAAVALAGDGPPTLRRTALATLGH